MRVESAKDRHGNKKKCFSCGDLFASMISRCSSCFSVASNIEDVVRSVVSVHNELVVYVTVCVSTKVGSVAVGFVSLQLCNSIADTLESAPKEGCFGVHHTNL